jgi:hypothetical protein
MGPYFWTQMPLRHGVIGFKVERFFRIQAYASAKNGKIKRYDIHFRSYRGWLFRVCK